MSSRCDDFGLETRLGWRTDRKFLRNPHLNEISLPTVDFYTHWTYILYMPIFSRIFLSNYWWQKSDIWSQALYRYPIRSELNLQPVYQTSIGNVTEVQDKGIFWSVTVNVSSRCNVTAQIESVQNKMNCELMLTYDTPALRQTGSRNLTGQKTRPTIWGTYIKLVTKYQISAINSCWEKCD
jgi:hypothetical protein